MTATDVLITIGATEFTIPAHWAAAAYRIYGGTTPTLEAFVEHAKSFFTDVMVTDQIALNDELWAMRESTTPPTQEEWNALRNRALTY
jgi:hypothetical protein